MTVDGSMELIRARLNEAAIGSTGEFLVDVDNVDDVRLCRRIVSVVCVAIGAG